MAAIPNNNLDSNYTKPADYRFNQESCSICWDDFHQGDRIRKLACEHIFHSQCLSGWRDGATCPMHSQDNAQNENGMDWIAQMGRDIGQIVVHIMDHDFQQRDIENRALKTRIENDLEDLSPYKRYQYLHSMPKKMRRRYLQLCDRTRVANVHTQIAADYRKWNNRMGLCEIGGASSLLIASIAAIFWLDPRHT